MIKRIFITITFVLSFVISTQAQSKATCPSCGGAKTTIQQCSHCHNGAIFCSVCSGRGAVAANCGSCGGSGMQNRSEKTQCPSCNGQRYSRENRPVSCTCRGGKRPVTSRSGGVTYVDCSRCGGKGTIDNYVNVACRQCGATGYTGSHTVSTTCGNCHGSGTISNTCTHCSGNGSYACSTCGGYARMRVDCTTCRGEGYVYVKD